MADKMNMPAQTRRFRTSQGKPRSIGRSLGLLAGDTTKVVEQVQRGFLYAAIARFHKASGLSVASIADLIRIPQRTLMRRKANGRLEPEESERLLRISGIFEKAVDLFEGDANSARRWLMSPSKELDHQTPLDFSRTEIGAREVEDLMGRLEHGVFS
jgi:putative toxin-antitoxin system antitoxin component (TIGR02293 family)